MHQIKLFLDPYTKVKAFLISFILIGMTMIIFVPAAAAGMITVNDTGDAKISNDGACTLREAVIAANSDKQSGGHSGECDAGSGADTIILPAGTYTLTRTDNGKEDAATTGDLDVLDDLTIMGAGADVTTIDGSALNDRVLHALEGSVAISGVTIRGGTVSENGGGIHNGTDLSLTAVSLEANTASQNGGGIYNSAAATLTVADSTISGNNAAGDGGGFYNAGGTAVLTNSTLSGNSGSGFVSQSNTELLNVTIADNANGSFTAANTVFAGACSGTLNSGGHNLISNPGCTISGDATGNILSQPAQLDALANYGGSTLTHALLPGSPAIEAGNNAVCPATDQRGLARPIGAFCDIGAFEFENPPQIGPEITINTDDDTDDGACTYEHCSLREAINAANSSTLITTINFDILGAMPPTIFPQSALPTVTAPVTIDGTTQTGGSVVLDGGQAGPDMDGLTITGGSSTVLGLEIINFSGSGIVIGDNGDNLITNNVIANNDGNGITIVDSTGNQMSDNNIHDNGGLSIDLGDDGRTQNDTNDDDDGANFVQNFPVLLSAVADADLTVGGYLNSRPDTEYTLEFFAGDTCPLFGGGSQTTLGSTAITTAADGNVYFSSDPLPTVADGQFVTVTATDPNGNTSELSDCIVVGPNNTSWPNALPVDVAGDLTPTAVSQFLDRPSQSRWYRFPVQPNSKIIVSLTDLPANYDLTIYRDIQAAYDSLTHPDSNADLALLGAEFAPEAFTPEAFTPEAFSPEAFTPEAFTPEAFTPEAFTASVFSPEAFTPEAFTAEAFSPEAFTPEAFTPEAFTPEAFTPEAFTPEAFTPEAFTPEAFTGAQLRSLLGVSAFRGTAGEGLIVNTWNNTGYFYVRVRGANGAFDQQSPFRLEISMLTGQCGDVGPITTAGTYTPTANGYQTVILTDVDRMEGTAAEKAAMMSKLETFAARPEVSGVIVDVGSDARVAAANAQADAHPACPYAKNLLADTIKEIVDGYGELNPLEYIVIVGNDGVIPFYRYPDNALLANENNFVPPVLDASPSQASLRLGYVLGQDAYGTDTEVGFKNSSIPIPQLGVGRLVETAFEVSTMLDAYLLTIDGETTLTTPPLVTGYDFLEDAALAVQSELEAGTGTAADTLIAPQGVAPTDPLSWTADDLRTALLGSRHDLVYLAGHFSASGALAADYSTRLTAAELAASDVDLRNVIVSSGGCHSGYNLVDADGVPFVTESPDWAQAFASKGATLFAGSGYQYGDTQFLEYSERLYLEFSQALRSGTGPVSVGDAVVAAKQIYLAETPQMRGIHQKVLIEATLFGFPMLSVDMPGARLTPAADDSIVNETTAVPANPGQTLGLTTADVTVTPQLTQQTELLENIADGTLVAATYFEGSDGIFTSPAEPTLPLETVNVDVPGTVLRGVGFRGGSYTDLQGILPFTGAPTTEIRGVHAPFLVDYFYPIQLLRTNYFDTLANGGPTRLALTPAQFKSSAPSSAIGTMRTYNNLDLRLYYSSNVETYGAAASIPSLAAPPTIVQATAVPTDDAIQFELIVTGNPAAGIQEVWVTYTATSGPYAGQWQSLDLSQNLENSTQWTGTLPLNGTNPDEIRFLAQAVNGVGLVSLAANLGDAYPVGVPTGPPPAPADLNLDLSTSGGAGPYGTQTTFRATLTANDAPLAGETVTFGLGLQSRSATTDANGEAVLEMTLLGLPGDYGVRASFAGTAAYAPASDTDTFTITKQDTVLTLAQPASGFNDDEALLMATLTDTTGRRLLEKTVFFVITGAEDALSRAVITDYNGNATLGDLPPLPPGDYDVQVYFNGTILLHTGETLMLEDARYNPATTSGTLTILNTAPAANDDNYVTAEDTTLTVPVDDGVLANDVDLNGSPLTAVLTSSPQHGAVTLNTDGSFSYTPDTNFNGTDSFGYVAHDGTDDSNEATVTITVTPVNDAPVANDDVYTVDQDTVLTVAAPGVLANDSDVEGDALTAALNGQPASGTVTLSADGSFSYTPNAGFYGTDSFSYTTHDGDLSSQPTTVTITVNQVNTAPDCSNAYSSVETIWPLNKDLIPVNVLGVTDADGDPVTITITAIFQDEPTGKGSNSPDGFGVGTDTALVRAERDGSGDGRVYHIFFTASDGKGGQCAGELRLPTVAHDQSYDLNAMDGGALYDSTVPE